MFSRKQAESFSGRNFYKGNGVDWGRFLPWLLAAFVVAAILAEGMAQLFRLGHYYIFVIPLVAASAVGGMINLAVNRGHCRSTVIAGSAGFCAGLLLYLGYFYFGMIHDFGPEIATHPEMLPSYIRLRMATEVTQDIHESNHDNPRKPTGADNYVNWARSAFELILVVAVATGFGLKRARKPYCTACRRWTTRELSQFDPGVSSELMEALRNHSARSLAALCAKAPFSTIPNVTLAADFCPSLKEGISRDCPAYLSLKEISIAPKKAVTDTFEQSKGKLLVQNLQLETDELPALAPRFKFLEAVTGRSAVNALLPAEEPEALAREDRGTYAEITPLPPEHFGKILTQKSKLIGNAFALGILLGFIGGMCIVLWGLTMAFPDHPPVEGVTPEAKGIGIALIVFGLTWFVLSLAIGLIDMSFCGNRYLRKMLRRELARRTSLMVDPSDPDAIFAEVVPKMNWGKMMLDNASDVGLLIVDRQRREIRFEGDHERWRIPAAAITQCQFEKYVTAQGHAKTKAFYAVVRVNHRDGFWEAPIRQRGRHGMISRNRKNETLKLVQAIESIRNVNQQAVSHI